MDRKEVTRRWEAARANLKSALQTFHDASVDLIRHSHFPSSLCDDRIDLETSLKVIDSELPGLIMDSNKLRDTCISLSAIRNTSVDLSPMNKLPLEVLHRIFEVVVAHGNGNCDRHHRQDELRCIEENWRSYATTLSSVNATWRRLMVNNPLFWSHIDVYIDIYVDIYDWSHTPTKYAELCLQRAKGTPLDLHVSCLSNVHLPYFPEITELPECLEEHTVASLNLALKQAQLVQPLLLAFRNTSLMSELEDLKVGVCWYRESTAMPARFSRQLGSNIVALRTLDLRGVYMDWDQIRFPGLVELAIDSRDVDITLSMGQLQDILVASPELRTLRIAVKIIKPGYPSDSSLKLNPAVRLNKLTFLGLGCMDASEMSLVLGLVQPSECPVLSIGVFTPEDYYTDTELYGSLRQAISSFCTQYKVRALILRMFSNPDQPIFALPSVLSPLHGIHTLALSDIDFGTETPPGTLVQPLGNMSALVPTLRGLHLHRCKITDPELRRIVSECAIQWLRFDHCMIFQEEANDMSGSAVEPLEYMPPFPDDLLEWLRLRVPDLYVINGSLDVVFSCGHLELPWWRTAFM